MLIALIAVLFIRPFFSSHAFPFAHALCTVALTAVAAAWLINRRARVTINDYVLCVPVALSLMAALSSWHAAAPVVAARESANYAVAALLYLVGRTFSAEERPAVMRMMAAAGVCAAILAIYQYYAGFSHTLAYLHAQGKADAFTLDYLQRRRAFFPFVTPNILAGYLTMAGCLAAGVVRGWWYLAPLAWALMLTKSIGGMATAGSAVLVYMLARGKRRVYVLATVIAIAMLGGGVLVQRHLHSLRHQDPAFSTSMRLEYWQQAATLIARHPLAGVGAGNFNLPRSRYAHNSYLQLWAELGPLGILAFLAAIGVLAAAVWRRRKTGPLSREQAALAACVAAFLVHNIVDFGFFLPEVNFLWWLTAGMLLTSFHERTQQPT